MEDLEIYEELESAFEKEFDDENDDFSWIAGRYPSLEQQEQWVRFDADKWRWHRRFGRNGHEPARRRNRGY